VRRGDAQLPFVAARELFGEPLDVAGVEQDAFDDLGQFACPARSAPAGRLPLAHEDLDAEFVLEILDVLADARAARCTARSRPRSG
jgi:hypothetical protein